MAKILFIQKELSEKFGTMILSAVLKNAGHKVDLFIELSERTSIDQYINNYSPDFLAFSITTIEKEWAVKLAKKLKKKFDIKTIFGGAEPTYDPESLIKEKSVDYLCRGEGEKGLVELINRIEKRKSILGIENYWGKENGKIIRNNLGELIKNLDALPIPDREIYFKYKILRNLSTKKILASRGCPYSCTYCSNHAYSKLFRGLGSPVRFRSPEKVIEEIIYIQKKYGFKRIYFADETFTLNHKWLFKFLDLYKKKIDKPFSCLARINELDEETIRKLKKNGCFYVAFGVESGSERLRNGILKRNMLTKDIVKVSKLMNKYNLPFLSHVIFVLPTETLVEAWDTVNLNAEIKADSIWGTVFQPLKNTEIYDYCLKNKLIPNNFKVDSMFGESRIKNSDKKLISNLRKLAWYSIRWPVINPLVTQLIKLPNNFIFEILFKLSEVYSIRKRWQLSYFEMIRLAWGTGRKLG